MKKVTVYTDGGARNNPGIAGAGAYIVDEKGEELMTAKKYLGIQTNNWAEYEAVILGLETLINLFGDKTKELEVEMKMDSQLVQRQLKREYKVKESSLLQQFIKINNLVMENFPNIKYTHIPRRENGEADSLANQAMDEK